MRILSRKRFFIPVGFKAEPIHCQEVWPAGGRFFAHSEAIGKGRKKKKKDQRLHHRHFCSLLD